MNKYICVKNYHGIKKGETVSLMGDRDYKGIDLHTGEASWHYFYRITDDNSRNLNISQLDSCEYFEAIK